MYCNCILVLSLAVFGASANPCGVFGVTSGVAGVSGVAGLSGVAGVAGSGLALPGTNTFAQTPVIQNPASFVPSYIPPASVSQSCHGLKTIVRPQIHNEFISVPMVDQLVRYVPGPVEAISVNTAGNTRTAEIPTYGINTGVAGVATGAYPGAVVGSLPAVGYNGIVGSGIVGSGIVGSGIVGSGVVGSGVVGAGVVGAGVVGNYGCGSALVA